MNSERWWVIRRGFLSYHIKATSRSKAKYAAYLTYKKRRKNYMPFINWVSRVKYARLEK